MIKKAWIIAIKPFLLINNENNTLVILTPGFAASEADTTCLPLQQSFVKHLKEMHPQLNIIILSFQYPYYKSTYKLYESTVISFNGQNKAGLAKLLLRRKIHAALDKIKSNNKITGLVSFWYGECALVGHRFANKNQLKHFCWLLGQDAKKENNYPSLVKANAGELVALSDFLQNEFEKNHGIKPRHLITPGVDPKQFNNAKEKDIDVLGAGSLIPLKQYDQFIEIIAEIKKTLPAIKAMLVGDGVEKEKLTALIFKYDLPENLILIGELPHDEVLQLMQRTKALLHTSSYEGFSGVCLEALSAGANVISFCKPMNKDIDHWYIVKDKNEMMSKTISILQNENEHYNPSFPFLITDTVKAFAALL